jgi:hypothetical protein
MTQPGNTKPDEPIVSVTLTANDATLAGLQMRVLSRTARVPDEVAELLERVGRQLFAQGRLAAEGGSR